MTLAAYKAKPILEGALSLLPGGQRLVRTGTGGSDSARYCYSVWMRHLIRTFTYRGSPFAGTVVELGPGDSVGTGLAALLSGARRYIAIDVVQYADVVRNHAVLDELVELFRRRAPVPASDEFPLIRPGLDDYAFPETMLDAEAVGANFVGDRIAVIAGALRGDPTAANKELPVRYIDPVAAADLISAGSVDWVFSQAVLEHVDDPTGVYRSCHDWLSPGGLMSHQIDFESHGTSREWNGHWAYPDLVWRLLRGRRPYLLNRLPCGCHLEALADAGFEILAVDRARRPSRLYGGQLAKRFRGMNDDDLTTVSAFVVARKRSGRGAKGRSAARRNENL